MIVINSLKLKKIVKLMKFPRVYSQQYFKIKYHTSLQNLNVAQPFILIGNPKVTQTKKCVYNYFKVKYGMCHYLHMWTHFSYFWQKIRHNMGWAYLGIVVCVGTFRLTPIVVDKGIKYTQTLSKVTIV